MRSKLARSLNLTLTLIIGLAAVIFSGSNETFSTKPRTVKATAPLEIEEEEYAVYSALLNEGGSQEKTDRLLVIEDQPTAWTGSLEGEQKTFYDDLKKSSPHLLADTVEDLKAKSKENFKLTYRFSIKRSYVLVSKDEIANFFKQGIGGGGRSSTRDIRTQVGL